MRGTMAKQDEERAGPWRSHYQSLCGDYVDSWVADQLADETMKRLAKIERLQAELDAREEYSICDCCECLTADPVDAGDHVQCQSCTKVANLQAENDRLREAIGMFVHEATHLSPQEYDGSHWAKISADCLSNARQALKGTTNETEGEKR
jgi:hypothetical protein